MLELDQLQAVQLQLALSEKSGRIRKRIRSQLLKEGSRSARADVLFNSTKLLKLIIMHDQVAFNNSSARGRRRALI